MKKNNIGIYCCNPDDWFGGYNYYKKYCKILVEKANVFIFFPLSSNREVINNDPDLENVNVIFVDFFESRIFSAVTTFFIGENYFFKNICQKYEIDYFLSNGKFWGWKTSVTNCYWIPDLQHLYLPHMFSYFKRIKRTFGFKMQLIFGDKIVVSSHDSFNHLKTNFTFDHKKVQVVRFVSYIQQPSKYNIQEVKQKYGINEDYIFLPNQYWPHKNHRFVLEALRYNQEKGVANCLVVSSGSPSKNTDLADLFAQCGSDSYMVLGNIPYKDVVCLLAGAKALLNPSLFEGWSTTVEEAKCLQKTLILSDLSIHKEQAEDYGNYFNTKNITSLSFYLSKEAKFEPVHFNLKDYHSQFRSSVNQIFIE